MKIIEAGLTEKFEETEYTCGHCKAKLLVAKEDLISWTDIDDYSGDTILYGGYRCPLCENLNVIWNLHRGLVDKLPRRR